MINYSALPVIVADNVKLVGCMFLDCHGHTKQGTKIYAYKTTIADLKIGEHVVVVVRGEPKVVEVVSLDCAIRDEYDYKWIVCRVDYDEYEQSRQAEEDLCVQVRTKQDQVQREQILRALGIEGDDGIAKLTFGLQPENQ